jgi:hypothetical protein
MSNVIITGSCLCGAVRYELTERPIWSHNCYCSRCRKATGAGFASNLFVPLGALRYSQGEHHLRSFHPPDAELSGTRSATSAARRCPIGKKPARALWFPWAALTTIRATNHRPTSLSTPWLPGSRSQTPFRSTRLGRDQEKIRRARAIRRLNQLLELTALTFSQLKLPGLHWLGSPASLGCPPAGRQLSSRSLATKRYLHAAAS